MSWIDDALNTPEAVITEFVKDELPVVDKVIISWIDNNGAILFQPSQMTCIEALGLLEAIKGQILEQLWDNGEEDASTEV